MNAAGWSAGDVAPGWKIRCPVCGRCRDAGSVGVVRFGAASIGKRVPGFCRECRRLRILIVYKERFDRADADPDGRQTWSELIAYVAEGTMTAETAERIHATDVAEARKREIAAYVAEGLIESDDALSLLKLEGISSNPE